jgi:hypothetical protein
MSKVNEKETDSAVRPGEERPDLGKADLLFGRRVIRKDRKGEGGRD